MVEDGPVAEWLRMPLQKECADHLSALEAYNLARGGIERSREQDEAIVMHLATVTAHFQIATDSAPPTTTQLFADKAVVDAAGALPEIGKLECEIAAISDLIEGLAACENALRTAIRTQTSDILQAISEEIRRLWSKLHPAEPIEGIKLYLPEDADKAIDIGLRFFGTEQPSPRLTLSEGHRNSLGLCIFLALVKMDATADRPVVLDDVVSSLDREHRGFLVDVIKEDFADRQVLLFTHDREWFAELRARLPSANWAFMSLLPWRSPDMGLQWSGSVFAFDEARALLASNPEAAGNRIRANMDADLAVIAEKLRLLMPFARGDRNDRRMASEFLLRLIGEAQDRLRKKDGASWTRYPEPIEDWREAHSLLVSWANRASHSGSLTSPEAARLLAACERALGRFNCASCNDPLWIADQAGPERLQCSCGELQWRYG
jgi:hypothetical protein